MKSFADNYKRSAPAIHRSQPSRFGYRGTEVKAQQAEIHRILRSTGAQAKLTISEPNDKYEQEADRVADQVLAIPDPKFQRQPENEREEETLQTKPLGDQITPLVQRQEEPPDEEEEPLQAKTMPGQTPDIHPICPECEEETAQRQPTENEEKEEEELQVKSKPGETTAVTQSLESRINSLKGGGQPIDPATRTFFEPRLGHDFSHVRMHTDSEASDTARSINAKAFTLGEDLVFGAGEYQPMSTEGKRLIAHELTHIIQQQNMKSKTVTIRNKGDDPTGIYEQQDDEELQTRLIIHRQPMKEEEVHTEALIQRQPAVGDNPDIPKRERSPESTKVRRPPVTEDVDKLIETRFHIVAGNIDVKHAEIILLGETHTIFKDNYLIGKLIDALSREQSIVLLEVVPLGKVVEESSSIVTRKKVTLIGWDDEKAHAEALILVKEIIRLQELFDSTLAAARKLSGERKIKKLDEAGKYLEQKEEAQRNWKIKGIEKRNKSLLKAVKTYYRKGSKLFVVSGALHFKDKELLKYLEERKYVILDPKVEDKTGRKEIKEYYEKTPLVPKTEYNELPKALKNVVDTFAKYSNDKGYSVKWFIKQAILRVYNQDGKQLAIILPKREGKDKTLSFWMFIEELNSEIKNSLDSNNIKYEHKLIVDEHWYVVRGL